MYPRPMILITIGIRPAYLLQTNGIHPKFSMKLVHVLVDLTGLAQAQEGVKVDMKN